MEVNGLILTTCAKVGKSSLRLPCVQVEKKQKKHTISMLNFFSWIEVVVG